MHGTSTHGRCSDARDALMQDCQGCPDAPHVLGALLTRQPSRTGAILRQQGTAVESELCMNKSYWTQT